MDVALAGIVIPIAAEIEIPTLAEIPIAAEIEIPTLAEIPIAAEIEIPTLAEIPIAAVAESEISVVPEVSNYWPINQTKTLKTIYDLLLCMHVNNKMTIAIILHFHSWVIRQFFF